MDLKNMKKKQCPNCGEYNRNKAEYCKYCSYRFVDDGVFFKRLRGNSFLATVFGIVGFEVLYILAFWLTPNTQHSNMFIFGSMIIPVIGIISAIVAKRFKIYSSLMLLLIGIVYVLLEIFLLCSIGVLFKGKESFVSFIFMMLGVTLPNLISGTMFALNGIRLFLRVKKENTENGIQQDYRIYLLGTIIVGCLVATGMFILTINFMFS